MKRLISSFVLIALFVPGAAMVDLAGLGEGAVAHAGIRHSECTARIRPEWRNTETAAQNWSRQDQQENVTAKR